MIRPHGSCSLRNMGSCFYCLFIRRRPHVFGYFLQRTFFFRRYSLPFTSKHVFGHENGQVFKTRGPRFEILENALFSFTFRWTKTEVFVYNDLIHHVLVACSVEDAIVFPSFYNLAFSSAYANTQHATNGNIRFQKYPDLSGKAYGLTKH